MRLVVAAVGRARRDPLAAAFDTYAGRLVAPLGPLTLREIDPARDGTVDARRRVEAAALLATVPADAVAVVLDRRGRDLASEDLAARLADWRDGGVRTVCFLIGGADGLDDAVHGRADLVLSFGQATWPHLLARVMLAEQLYRSATILAGHPYHRG